MQYFLSKFKCLTKRDNMVTIRDVAALANVSIATVSNVINKNGKVAPETEKRVLKAIRELNYIPNNAAKGLKTNQSNYIGIIAEDVCALATKEIIDGISEYCEINDLVINLRNLRVLSKINTSTFYFDVLNQNQDFIKLVSDNIKSLLTNRIIGLIYIGAYPRDISCLIPDLDIPVVYTYVYSKNKNAVSINYDDFQAAKMAVDFLIKQYHTRIALICGPIDSVPAHKRMLGYQTSLMEHNVTFCPEYIKTGNWHYEDGYNACKELMNLPNPPTAIFAMSDLMAIGALDYALDRGYKVPDDLSIHGFDCIEASLYVRPRLTTISLPLKELGLQAAETLIKLVNNEAVEENNILLPCKHVIKESVKIIN